MFFQRGSKKSNFRKKPKHPVRLEVEALEPRFLLVASPLNGMLSGGASTLTATREVPLGATVAWFSDTDPQPIASDFKATVDWGDGTALDTSASVSAYFSGFLVTGSHTYTALGTDPLSVTITDQDGASLTVTGSVTVTDFPITVSASPISATAGNSFNGPVASFTGTAAGQATAQINWGDGSQPGSGTISGPFNGSYECPYLRPER